MFDRFAAAPQMLSGPPSVASRVSIPTGKHIHHERLHQLQALNASYGELVRKTQRLLADARLDAVQVARLDETVQELTARKATTGVLALLEAGFDPNAADYSIDEQTGEVIKLGRHEPASA